MCADTREAIPDASFHRHATLGTQQMIYQLLDAAIRGTWRGLKLYLRHLWGALEGGFNWLAMRCCCRRGLLGDELPRRCERDSAAVRVRVRCGLAMQRVRTPCR